MASGRRVFAASGGLLVSLLLWGGAPARGQTAAASGANAQGTGTQKAWAFEVATIREHPPGPRIATLGGPAGRFEATNVTAKTLVMTAFHLPEEQVSGGPAWADTQAFDVKAKVGDSDWQTMKDLPQTQKDERMREMLQALLRDRFQLAVRHEPKEMTVYALVAAKGGPKLPPAGSPDPPRDPHAGTRYLVMGADWESVPVNALAGFLSDYFGRTVLDRTDLKGNYHIRFEVEMPEERSSAAMESAVLEAVQDQLGMKLETTKAVVDTIVIEHLEEPSAN